MYDFPKIQFGDKDFYVVDTFEYDGKKYYYIYEDVYVDGMDISNFDGDMEVNFIFKREDGKFENVVDDNLFKKLLNIASKRLILNQNKMFKKENDN